MTQIITFLTRLKLAVTNITTGGGGYNACMGSQSFPEHFKWYFSGRRLACVQDCVGALPCYGPPRPFDFIEGRRYESVEDCCVYNHFRFISADEFCVRKSLYDNDQWYQRGSLSRCYKNCEYFNEDDLPCGGYAFEYDDNAEMFDSVDLCCETRVPVLDREECVRISTAGPPPDPRVWISAKNIQIINFGEFT